MAVATAHLILYDGVCGLCNRLIGFVLPRDRQGVFRYAAIQSPTGRRILESFGRDPDLLDTIFVVTNYEAETPALHSKSGAALFIAGALGWPWKLATVLRALPRPVLDWGYDRVAKSRYKIFGHTDTCMLPAPAFRSRFLDTGI